MADIPRCMSAALIDKLHALAERRCAHLLELHQSGRWTRFYSREAFIAEMNGAAQAAKLWQEVVDAVCAPAPELAPVAEVLPVELLDSQIAVVTATSVEPWRATVSAAAADIITAA